MRKTLSHWICPALTGWAPDLLWDRNSTGEEVVKCWRDLGQFRLCQPSNSTPHPEAAPTPLAGWVGRLCPISSRCVFLYSFLPLSKPCPGVFTCSQLEKWAMFYKHGTTVFASWLPVDLRGSVMVGLLTGASWLLLLDRKQGCLRLTCIWSWRSCWLFSFQWNRYWVYVWWPQSDFYI